MEMLFSCDTVRLALTQVKVASYEAKVKVARWVMTFVSTEGWVLARVINVPYAFLAILAHGVV